MRKISRETKLRWFTLRVVIINGLEILASVALVIYAVAAGVCTNIRQTVILSLIALITTAGAVMDIWNATVAQDVGAEGDRLEDALSRLETLNGTLRKQRHDFLNHLQVVFGLIELDEKDEARAYIERIYGDIHRVSGMLRTAIPALNAQLAAKKAEYEALGITLALDIESDWQDCPVPAWELCRVAGNILDNARDAVRGKKDARIQFGLNRTGSAYILTVTDNGGGIPEEVRGSIFQEGFSTKGAGHGSGLAIVGEILHRFNGTIDVRSSSEGTIFTCTFSVKEAASDDENPGHDS